MPRVSEFYGISIHVYFDDHGPPHFHARAGEFEALIRIDDVTVLRGYLPPRALGLVVEWTVRRRTELNEAWRQAQAMEILLKIPPLE